MKKQTAAALNTLCIFLRNLINAGRWHVVGGDGTAYYYDGLTPGTLHELLSVMDKLPAMEECLARGGMVKGWDGAWCREGDRVRFRETAGSEFETGELHYDDSSFSWYVFSDRTQDSPLLGDVYEWYKEKNDDEV